MLLTQQESSNMEEAAQRYVCALTLLTFFKGVKWYYYNYHLYIPNKCCHLIDVLIVRSPGGSCFLTKSDNTTLSIFTL